MNASVGASSLAGVRVLDCGDSLVASYCCELLHGLGADVIKIEDPAEGEAARQRGPYIDDVAGPERSALFHYVSGGKRGVTLNLRSAEGRQLLLDLARQANVLVSDRRPSVATELGLAPGPLHDANASLIVASITPFGSTGPRAEELADDLILAHAGGLAYAQPGLVPDPPSHPPLRGGGYQASFSAAVAAANNIVVAVLAAELDPDGHECCHIDFSCHEALVNLFRQSMGSYCFHGTGLGRNLAKGRGAGGSADARSIRCKDGYVQILWGRWDRLQEVMGGPEWMSDPRVSSPSARFYETEYLESMLEEWTLQYGKQEIFHRLQAAGVPCAPVNSGSDLLESAQLEARGFWHEVAVPKAGPIRLPGALASMSGTPWTQRTRGPLLGEHNSEVYGELLGLPSERIAELSAAATI